MHVNKLNHTKFKWLVAASLFGIIALSGLFLTGGQTVLAQVPQLHPTFPLVDTNGDNVLESGQPVSTMQTCGSCHDTTFIQEHSFHSDVGLDSFSGDFAENFSWDGSPGYFGRWNPLTYRYLSLDGDAVIDLTTAEWVQTLGTRHVGGGPAEYSRTGVPLTELEVVVGDLETSIVDPVTGELVAWDWQESGVVEMNCFLCHTPNPNNEARIEMLQAGEFKWANTATLAGTELVERVDGEWQWNEAAFDAEGNLTMDNVPVQDPTSENCSLCHGLVHVDSLTPLSLGECEPSQWTTITTGQIFSPQRLADSGINFMDKHDLSRAWDVHAERVLECTDCHYSLNNPVYFQESAATRPDHLIFDPRRIDLGEYLYRPLHEFAKGENTQSSLAPELDNTLRQCESCHSIENNHDWLPYKDAHIDALSCETCHIPQLYGPARQYNDWTVLKLDGSSQSVCRGVDEASETFGTAVVTGYEPVLLPRENADETISLAPYNLVTSWFWVYGDPERPVPIRNLEAAWLVDGSYNADVLAAFDRNDDGELDTIELVIDTEAKELLIASRLEEQGLENPRIDGVVQPYGINHDVAHGEWATRDCESCHEEDSRIVVSMVLADRLPGGVTPTFVGNMPIDLNDGLSITDEGELVYHPQLSAESVEIYVFGHSSISWIDWLGVLMFLGTLAGVSLHGGLRYLAARRSPAPHDAELKKVYMYSLYERQWHWLQTVVIMGLIFTGLIIHKPAMFGIFSFRYVVEIHNVLALILVINAALAAFYHLVSGEIQQYLPQPRGFFSQAMEQAKYYAGGIFRGEPHPAEKTRERKLNPLQQITYFGILNVLLPLQVITGALIWGVQRWPDVASSLGGLPLLAPFHTIVAWSFATFIVAHVYLTTTAGHTPVAGIKSMIMGWDDVEVHHSTETSETDSNEEVEPTIDE
jgi:thiosulfate reductase cytochrome b subunit